MSVGELVASTIACWICRRWVSVRLHCLRGSRMCQVLFACPKRCPASRKRASAVGQNQFPANEGTSSEFSIPNSPNLGKPKDYYPRPSRWSPCFAWISVEASLIPKHQSFPQTTFDQDQMPKVRTFAPAWLNVPSPGHKLFEQPIDDSKLPAALAHSKKWKPGPRRTVANRGTEVFVAVGKQIRWGDLSLLKESWENQSRAGAGIRVPRHDYTGSSFEVYDEEAAAGNGNSGASPDGYRVRTVRSVLVLTSRC